MRKSSRKKSVILLEFNELCPELVQRFMTEGHLPGFSRLHQQSQVYITRADERAPELEPWIQWVTVHTGMSYREHGVFTLDEGQKVAGNQLWDYVSGSGGSVWVCGSMNIASREDLNGFALPDPWANDVKPHPAGELDDYYDFVQHSVREHTNTRAPSGLGTALKFLLYMFSHGLSLTTCGKVICQVLREKLTGKYKWQRASVLDWIQWDVFCHYWKRERPVLATFFLNSTAHYQHVFWRNMQPELFDIRPGAEEQAEYKDAILFGYQSMDKLIVECMEMADENTTVVLVTALSQQPCLKYENAGGKNMYRPHSVSLLLEFAGLDQNLRCTPLMSEKFLLRTDSEAEASHVWDKFAELRMDDDMLLRLEKRGADVLFGCNLFDELDYDPVVSRTDGTKKNLSDLFYMANETKSGMHHPDGLFWVCEPGTLHKVYRECIPLTDVAPTVLGTIGLPKQPVMRGSDLTRPSSEPTQICAA